MTGGSPMGTTASTLAVVLLVLVAAAAKARAQSLVEVVPEDPCEQARLLDEDDDSPPAEHVRRACRLRRFGQKLEAERQEDIMAAENAREARIQRWVDNTQPPRVTRPFSIEGFAGTGISSYGLAASWAFLRQADLSAWFGRRAISCDTVNATGAGDCTRTSYGFHGRWYLAGTKLSPYLGTGMTFTSAHLQIVQSGSNGGGNLVSGSGRASSYNVQAGMQVAYQRFRASVEYVYEHAFYTGANTADMYNKPSPALNSVWSTSLNDDRHGFRVQAGCAF